MKRYDHCRYGFGEKDKGKYVLFTDHEKAAAEAYQRGLEDAAKLAEAHGAQTSKSPFIRLAKEIRAAKPEADR